MESVRTCANIRGKRHPHSRCTFIATNGEFCSRHWRNPRRWASESPPLSFTPSPTTPTPSRISRQQKIYVLKIQKFWCLYYPRIQRRRHGPTIFASETSENRNDLTTMEPITTIPKLYWFSYLDSKNHAWTFDIRYLMQTLSYEPSLKNPFTQEIFLPQALLKLQGVIEWLKLRKYPIIYVERDELTPEQLWNQRVLSVFFKYQSLGYTLQTRWFEQLSKFQHILLYQRLFIHWFFGPSAQERLRIVPDYDSPLNRLFRWPIEYASTLDFKTLTWWRKVTLSILERLVSSTNEKPFQTSGALLALTCLVQISTPIAQAYPFLVNDTAAT